jgi:hypothetical protein
MTQLKAHYEAIDGNAMWAFGLLVVSAKQRGQRAESDRSTKPG